MRKKVNVFGKGIPVLAIFVFGIALVSAALIPYFAQLTGLVTVDQGLSVDGNAYDVPIIYSATLTSLEEKTVSSGNHELQNAADVDAIVTLDIVCVSNPAGDGCDNVITTPIFQLGLPSEDEPNQVQDRVVTKETTTLDGITALSFDYILTEPTGTKSPYFVLALDTDSDGIQDEWAVSWQDNEMAEDEWFNYDGITNRDWHPGDGISKVTFAEIQSTFSGAVVVEVKVMLGYWGDPSATNTLVKNIKVNGASAIDNGIIVPDKSAEDVNGHVDFFIETYFPKMMKPAEYTITTKVLPVTA